MFTRKTMLAAISILLGAVVLTGCHRSGAQGGAAAIADTGVKLGSYRVVLDTPGGQLPFGLDLLKKDSHVVGYLVNGEERLLLSDVKITGSHLEIRMPGYENVLSADAVGDQLKGEIFLVKLHDKNQHVPLHAALGENYRFFASSATDNADVSGRWAVSFTDDSGVSEVAVGEFNQSHDIISGTFLTTTGDHRFLAGQVKGDEVYLSTFDGAHVFLYKAKIVGDGKLTGDFWSGLAFHEKWSAQRDAGAQLPDAYGLTAMRTGVKTFDFAFPDLAGKPYRPAIRNFGARC